MVIARGICPILAGEVLATDVPRRILRWLPQRLVPFAPVRVRMVSVLLLVLRVAPVRFRLAVFRY